MNSIMSVPPLTPLAGMLDRLLASLRPVAPATVPLGEALGLVAAEAVLAPHPVPVRPQALRRGIAVASSAVVGATPYAPAILHEAPLAVRPGDTLPQGCDAVLPADAVQALGPLHEIGQAAYPGEDVIAAGGDLAAGSTIVGAGAILTPSLVLALAHVGRSTLAVRQASIAVQVRDSEGSLPGDWLRETLGDSGCKVVTDQPADITVVIARSVEAGGLALNPSRDIGLDATGPCPVLTIPTRFDQVAAAWFAVLMPAVAALTGRRMRHLARPVTRKLVSQVGLSDIALLRTVEAGYEPLSVGRITLAALLAADAVAIVDPSSEGAAAGDLLPATPLLAPFEPQ